MQTVKQHNMRKTKLDEQLDSLGYFRMQSITIPGSYCLYRKDDRSFLAVFYKEKNNILYNSKTYKSVEDFLKAVEDYTKTLYFPADTYNPDYRKEAVANMRLHGTLRECGLEIDPGRYYARESYLLKDDLGGKFAHVRGTDLLLSETSWIPLKDDDAEVDEVNCRNIKSTIAAVYAYHISVLAESLNTMGELSKIDKLEIKTFNESTCTVETKSGKEGVIGKLEEVLNKLKGNG